MNINAYDDRTTPEPRYGRNASGYGRKIPTRYLIRWHGRWRRVYVACFGNAGTPYVVINGKTSNLT